MSSAMTHIHRRAASVLWLHRLSCSYSTLGRRTLKQEALVISPRRRVRCITTAAWDTPHLYACACVDSSHLSEFCQRRLRSRQESWLFCVLSHLSLLVSCFLWIQPSWTQKRRETTWTTKKKCVEEKFIVGDVCLSRFLKSTSSFSHRYVLLVC